jgi:hypothetical protein
MDDQGASDRKSDGKASRQSEKCRCEACICLDILTGTGR